ncbi:hypothetical protein OG429_33905 [Streptomyces sp. NBC_00190]|nr:hypothetical protein [Streptomyces sp. NBC_00190]
MTAAEFAADEPGIRSLNRPRLVTYPPPYRRSPVLRGPIHLHVEQNKG